MSEPPSRVRITAPARRRRELHPRSGDLEQATPLGEVYLRSLLREQLWLAARVLSLLAAGAAGVPLLFYLDPGLSAVRVGGFPVVWLALAGAVYPLLVLIGWYYVRRAERNERDFAELLSELDP